MIKTALARRGFLKLLPAAPLAAKVAADEATQKLMGGQANGFGATVPYTLGSRSVPSLTESGGLGELTGPNRLYVPGSDAIKASKYISAFGVPEWLEDELRSSLNHVYVFDVDIASKRSWSLAVKVATQRERNYQKAVRQMQSIGWKQQKLNALSKILGITFPWVRFW